MVHLRHLGDASLPHESLRQPKVFPTKATDKDLAEFKGIIEFLAFHVDLWNGKKLAGGSMSFFHRGKNVFLWPS